jgi:hypothetical protein
MSSYGDHLRVETQGALTLVTFAPARNPLLVLMGVLALCVTSPLLAAAGSGKMFASGSVPVAVFSLLLFLVFLGSCLGAAIWTLCGSWHTMIDAETLTVTMRVGPLARRWSYPLVDVQNVRISKRRTRGGFIRRIAFDFRGKRRYATPSLSRYEERVLLDGPFDELIR